MGLTMRLKDPPLVLPVTTFKNRRAFMFQFAQICFSSHRSKKKKTTAMDEATSRIEHIYHRCHVRTTPSWTVLFFF